VSHKYGEASSFPSQCPPIITELFVSLHASPRTIYTNVYDTISQLPFSVSIAPSHQIDPVGYKRQRALPVSIQ